jgi:hypothetical protein
MSAARGTSQRAERVSFPVNGGPAGLLPRLDGNMLIYMFPQGPGISEAFRSSPTPRTPSRLAASSRPRRPLRRPESRRLTAAGPAGPAPPPARRPRRPTGTVPPARRDSGVPVAAHIWPPPATAGVGSAPGGPDVGRTRRAAIAASRARPRAACRAPHSPPPAKAGLGFASGGPDVGRTPRVAIAASRARPRSARATRSLPPATAGVGSTPGGPDRVCKRLRRLVIIATSRARPRAARAKRWPLLATAAICRGEHEPSTSPCRSRNALAPARHSWRGICAGLPRCRPPMARSYRSKPRRTSPCRSRTCTGRPRCLPHAARHSGQSVFPFLLTGARPGYCRASMGTCSFTCSRRGRGSARRSEVRLRRGRHPVWRLPAARAAHCGARSHGG